MTNVQPRASKNGVEIIREFCDARPAEIDSFDRPAFIEMLEDWIKQRSDFAYVLCLDASRLDRFPNSDIAELVNEICGHYKKQLIYISDGKPRDNEAIKKVRA
jgi:DNA invertase Pin-like site-specific DNA recombinase